METPHCSAVGLEAQWSGGQAATPQSIVGVMLVCPSGRQHQVNELGKKSTEESVRHLQEQLQLSMYQQNQVTAAVAGEMRRRLRPSAAQSLPVITMSRIQQYATLHHCKLPKRVAHLKERLRLPHDP